MWLAAGRLALARRWADSCGLDFGLLPQYERKEEYLVCVRLLLREGKPDLALRILDRLREPAEATGRDGDLVGILVLTALAHQALGSAADAIRALDRALGLGEPGGYLRVFVDESEDLEPLLRHAAGRGTHRDYAKRLLLAIDGTAISERTALPGTPETLSAREVEVLRLAATGMTYRELGQRLFISEKTVKKHMNGILGKLQSTNRTEAVDRARRMGVL